MPRIRSLKPEHKAHRKVGVLSDRQYRLWVGLITEADDDGVFVASLVQIRGAIFPHHPTLKLADLASDLQRLAKVGLIRLWKTGRDHYGIFPDWHDHQRIHRDHYTTTKTPPPFNYRTRTGPVRDKSGTGTAGSEGIGMDRKGKDRIGSERKGGESEGRETEPPTAPHESAPSARSTSDNQNQNHEPASNETDREAEQRVYGCELTLLQRQGRHPLPPRLDGARRANTPPGSDA